MVLGPLHASDMLYSPKELPIALLKSGFVDVIFPELELGGADVGMFLGTIRHHVPLVPATCDST